jgi:N-acetylmuramoyl-L-alanine amidase
MPAVLVELAYLSNRDDRRLLQSRGGQVDLARTLLLGILAYRGDRDGLNLLAAAGGWTRQYRVQRGDTLWDLARRHRTTIARIREENNLRSLQIEAGQLLRLPELD